ncbi:hypothetical protein RHMOL_Rhmol05G0163400 [Rhododendron molle]|uniref:Uncharacterized protein n=1 Tax=Rhododendron molle TaxID=49168 RepID=A0ACC0NPK7_RHOML|nr:hypothetical protein RHMOL_Rhmol05G0163400 [Rhododendron molle]
MGRRTGKMGPNRNKGESRLDWERGDRNLEPIGWEKARPYCSTGGGRSQANKEKWWKIHADWLLRASPVISPRKKVRTPCRSSSENCDCSGRCSDPLERLNGGDQRCWCCDGASVAGRRRQRPPKPYSLYLAFFLSLFLTFSISS